MKKFSYYRLIFLLYPLSFLLFIACSNERDEIVATVNGQPVTSTELRHWMLLKKAEVHAYFFRKYGAIDGIDFWETRFGNELPSDILRKLALDQAVRFKIQQNLAFEMGIIENRSYDDLLKEMTKVNRQRLKMVQEGYPVYGPLQFSPRTYIDHVYDKMVGELKYQLAWKELKLNDQELLSMYPMENQNPGERNGFFQMQYVDQNYEGFIDNLISTADVEIVRDVYERIPVE